MYAIYNPNVTPDQTQSTPRLPLAPESRPAIEDGEGPFHSESRKKFLLDEIKYLQGIAPRLAKYGQQFRDGSEELVLIAWRLRWVREEIKIYLAELRKMREGRWSRA